MEGKQKAKTGEAVPRERKIKMDKRFYVAYGSNLNLPQMAKRCPGARIVGSSELKDYVLTFRGGHGGAVATVEPSKGNSVPVLVWDITEEDEKALDRYEGFPFLYRKESVRVNLEGKNIKAMVYIMNEGKNLGQPSIYYYSIIYDGYKAQDFNTEVLKSALKYSVERPQVEDHEGQN